MKSFVLVFREEHGLILFRFSFPSHDVVVPLQVKQAACQLPLQAPRI